MKSNISECGKTYFVLKDHKTAMDNWINFSYNINKVVQEVVKDEKCVLNGRIFKNSLRLSYAYYFPVEGGNEVLDRVFHRLVEYLKNLGYHVVDIKEINTITVKQNFYTNGNFSINGFAEFYFYLSNHRDY